MVYDKSKKELFVIWKLGRAKMWIFYNYKTIIKGDGKKQKSTLLYSLSTNENEIFKELIKDTQTWGSHWISLPYTVMTKEFGKVLW